MPGSWWRRLARRGAVDREIDCEIRAHIEHKRDALEREGLSPAEAERQARMAFGNPRVWQEEVREVWTFVWVEGVLRDVRFGLRTLAKDKLFAFFAVATLALGFGTTTAVFSLIHALLLRSLPVPEAERLTEVHMTNLPPDVVQWVNGRKVAMREMRGAPYSVMQALAGERAVAGVLGIAGSGESVVELHGSSSLATTATVSGGFFDTLRLSPMAGRFFTSADDVRGGPAGGWPVVLSYSGWARLFQKSPDAVGTVIHIERKPVIVAGIAPETFTGVNRGVNPDIYLPLHSMETFYGAFLWEGSRRVPQILVRLAPGLTFETARDQIAARSPVLLAAGGLPGNRSREEHLAQKLELRRVSASSSGAGRTYGQALWLLLAAVSAVLLITATNLTTLLLARAAQRGPEFAVRMALGAGAGRIRRQVLIEVSLIAAAGAVCGAVLAWQLPPALVYLISGAKGTIQIDTAPDATVLLFTAGLLIATTLIAGWAPAAASSRTEPNRMLAATARMSRSLHGRAALIAVQTALTMVLLLGTALLGNSLRELWRERTGMDGVNTAFFSPDLYNAGIDREHMGRAYENILRRARELPGVAAAAWTMTIPLSGAMGAFQVTAVGRPATADMSNLTFWHQVSDGYFSAAGLPMVAGRDFPAAATGRRNICVLSESAAVRLFGSANAAVGRQVAPGKLPPTEVIGVSGDAKYIHLREPAPPTIYTPYWNENVSPGMTLVLRPAGAELVSKAAIYQFFQEEAGRMPYVRFETMDSLREALTVQERALTWLLGGLAAFALLISTTGMAGLLAYSIQQRRKEIGVRLALGAPPATIRRGLLGRAMSWVGAGLVLGTAAAWPLRTVLDSFLYRNSVGDLRVWVGTLLVLGVTTGVAAWVPAVRAARTNVVEALRGE